jgi:hypothetical protein
LHRDGIAGVERNDDIRSGLRQCAVNEVALSDLAAQQTCDFFCISLSGR